MLTTTQPKRDAVLDILKFIAIFMVINGHTFQYSGCGEASLDISFIKFTTITQMPLFTFISGYVSYRAITTQPLWCGIMKRRWYSLIRPMLIFCLIWAVIQLAFYTPTPITPWVIVDTTLFSIKSSYWFIYVVLYCIILGYVATRWGGEEMVMLLTIALIQFVPDGTTIPPFMSLLKAMLPFFFGGMLFKKYDMFATLQRVKWISIAIATLTLGIGLWLYSGAHTFYFFANLTTQQHIESYVEMLGAGFASIILCYFAAQYFDKKFGNSGIIGIIKRLGNYTFAMYMIQGIVFAAMRQHAIHIDSHTMQLLLSLTIFLSICLCVALMSRSRLLSRLLLGKTK